MFFGEKIASGFSKPLCMFSPLLKTAFVRFNLLLFPWFLAVVLSHFCKHLTFPETHWLCLCEAALLCGSGWPRPAILLSQPPKFLWSQTCTNTPDFWGLLHLKWWTRLCCYFCFNPFILFFAGVWSFPAWWLSLSLQLMGQTFPNSIHNSLSSL